MFQSLGQRAQVNPADQAQPIIKSKRAMGGIDVPLMLTLIALVIFGLIMVNSASWDDSIQVYGAPTTIFWRQVMWGGLGVLVAGTLAFIDYHFLRKIAVPIMGVTIFMLILVLFIGEERNGAIRTLFRGSVQPSELAKLATIIYLGVWLFAKQERLNTVGFGLIPLGFILGMTAGWIFLQPDFSAVLTILFLGGVLFFLAGGSRKQLLLLGVISILIGFLVVNVSSTGRQRFIDYKAGWRNPGDASYHIQRAMELFARGGFLGVGIGKSETKLTGLPFPSTDSIFAVVGEETGFVGSAVLVILYTLLFWRGLTIAVNAPDELGKILAAGLTIWIAFEGFY